MVDTLYYHGFGLQALMVMQEAFNLQNRDRYPGSPLEMSELHISREICKKYIRR